jgi:hypothetical protein
MDRELFDFAGLDAERAARPESLRIPVKEG